MVVDQLLVEQVVHANNTPLNGVDLKESLYREGNVSSCEHWETMVRGPLNSGLDLWVQVFHEVLRNWGIQGFKAQILH